MKSEPKTPVNSNSQSSHFFRQLVLVLVLGLSIGFGLGLGDGAKEFAQIIAQAEAQSLRAQGVLGSPSHPIETAKGIDSQVEVIAQADTNNSAGGSPGDDFNFFSDEPIVSKEIVVIPPEKSKWITVGGPMAMIALMGLLLWVTKILIPFDKHSVDINLRNFPPAAKRGMAIAVVLFGIAFAFGASEIWYQLQFFGSSAEFIESMSLGKLIVMTHAHLFGFTTAFFIVGIPFSMQFNHIKLYQWIFPIGLVASLVDVMSWWGIKYVDHSFEAVSMVCALLFSGSYLFMLVGLLRTLAFPDVVWASDKDRAARLDRIRRKRAAKREFRKFFS